MDVNKSNTGWIVAGVLAVVVVVLLVLLWGFWNKEQHDLDFVLQQGKEDVMNSRDEIAAKCQGPTRNEKECQEALKDLAAILKEFSKDIDNATSSTQSGTVVQ